MKLTQLTLAIAITTLPMTGVFAAALDRSGQPMNAFFQDNNYFEASLGILDPTVSGKETGISTRKIDDMGKDYMFPTAALKLQPHEKFSIALLYDQPFGANAEYAGSNKFVSNEAETEAANAATLQAVFNQRLNAALVDFQKDKGEPLTAEEIENFKNNPAYIKAIKEEAGEILKNLGTRTAKSPIDKNHQGTHVDVHTETLSLVLGYQPTPNWNFYAGPVYQNIKADVNLRGTAYSVYNGYDLHVNPDGAVGWLAGIAYSKPEIALRAALTYRSEIDHSFNAKENFSNVATTAESKITTPQSINLDLQSGIAKNTLAFANIRWVNWSKFKFQPNQFGQVSKAVGNLVGKPDGFNLVEYSDDQISATIGLGHKFNEKWTGSLSTSWDSGAGDPVTTLGPVKGYWNVGVGVQYSPQKNYFIAGGIKHYWLGDAKAQTGAQAGTDQSVAEFSDNKAWSYGLKIGYKF